MQFISYHAAIALRSAGMFSGYYNKWSLAAAYLKGAHHPIGYRTHDELTSQHRQVVYFFLLWEDWNDITTAIPANANIWDPLVVECKKTKSLNGVEYLQ